MKRELKFRAWDNTTKTMVDDYAHVGQYGELHCTNFHPSAYSNDGCPDLVIEQFTGLKDKSGVEIFEGDILNGYWNEDYPKQVGHVTFEKGKFVCWVDLKHGTKGRVEQQFHNYEIIGNIHENPELLKGVK